MSKAPAVLVSLVFVLTAFVGIVPVALAAAPSPSLADLLSRLGTEEIFADGLVPQFDRLASNQAGPVVVMLKLPGDPVAVVASRMPDRTVSPEVKEIIKRDLKARQDALRPYIEWLGGEVVGQYQVAYNGIKIEIPRGAMRALAELPGVLEISEVRMFEADHTNSVPLIGTPAVWGGVPGFRGEGIKVAILDTGIDYTHANFGGPGTVEAFQAADKRDRMPADPTLFGPDAPKVRGGIDLVGDKYTGDNRPHPDPNPLDCDGHGSHVAGSAAGYGVTADGATYAGPYDTTTFEAPFRIGPGVAPLADLYAVRVFGCTGFTRVTVDAIEWAVDNDMDVINMSLGSVFGLPDASSAEASNNAALAGVIVVASAGNSGASPYITGSPAAADRAISVAASDPIATFPGAVVTLGTGATINALNANNAELPDGEMTVAVLRTEYPDGPISLGCDPAEYANYPGGVSGKLVVTLRGVCARVARAIFGEQAGAAAVAMINTAPVYPPFEGPITQNPDTGIPFEVTIPFLGIRGVLGPDPEADGDNLLEADLGTAALSPTTIPNPGFKAFASFTSGGPRSTDSVLKPDITAPGVSIQSTAVGTGNQGTRISGTSMSSPHVAGVAALVLEAHPTWTVEEIKAAIVNTGSPADVVGYLTRRGGTGLVQPAGATMTQSIAFFDEALVSQSFGFAELAADFTATEDLTIANKGSSSVTFTLSAAATSGSRAHTVTFDTTVTVDAGAMVTVPVTFTVPVATVGSSALFRNVAGLITLTPEEDANGGVALRVPYYLVPRALSDVEAELSDDFGPDNPEGTVTLTNEQGPISGNADFYAWGLADANEGLGEHDLRAVGVQSFEAPSEADPDRRLIVFAINTHAKWSNAAVNEFDLLLNTDGDAQDDFAVVGIDFGFVTAGSFDGRLATAVFNLKTGAASILFLATAPTDSSTVLLPVFSSQIGLSPSNPRLSYRAESFSLRGFPADEVPRTAKFNAYTPAISNGAFIPVAMGATVMTAVEIDPAEWKRSPALGILIVVLDNASGPAEARLLGVDT